MKLSEIEVLDNDILIQIKKPKDSKIILNPNQEKNLMLENRFKILQVGGLVNWTGGEDSGLTILKEGDIIVLQRDYLMSLTGSMTLEDFDYPNNATIIQRHGIQLRLKTIEL